MAQFDDLPNELVQLILTFISAEDNLRNVQRVNRLLHMLGSDPRIWRYHCSLMRYWSPHHSIEDNYASLWIRAVLTPTWDVSWKQCVLELVETVRASWPEDYWIVQRFCPPFNGLEIEQQRDQMRIQPTYRDARGGPAKYHVGQVFEHTKYGSIGVITGWIEDRSPRGYISSGDRDSGTEADEIKTIFYYCLAGQNALPALVSEGNIRIIRNLAKVPTELISRCGKYFTNIDAVKGEFISNIKDAYPDN
ncbi:hypothetical protein CFO_g844 [Ceratocystis platani]|uniref:F-box domain-containing protein n=1 Tax=Ceratocystis fimbriata f. sp. platani TaxID=88771 RepID=A0A0F8BW62_CERFI|nr:hypothetical protein CFO_g844 [Ceratocystis platani]